MGLAFSQPFLVLTSLPLSSESKPILQIRKLRLESGTPYTFVSVQGS